MKEAGSLRWSLTVVFVLGAVVRSFDVGHPVDGSIRESWREADYAAVARNFDREGMDILTPRIDWRGTGSGKAEMEFPALPWFTAALYRVFGYDEVFGRLLSYAFSLLTLIVFFALARRLLPGPGGLFASAFFALAPLSVRLSNALQPEAMMLFFYIGAALAFWRWLEEGSRRWYILALAATAAAILSKIPAAHIGILFILLIVHKYGWKGMFRPEIIVFGILALLPAVLWAWHAHRFWLTEGNSLGVSNEYHWIGRDMIVHPRWMASALFRILRMETTLTAMIPGLLLLPIILWTARRDRTMRLPLYWLIAVAGYYLLTIRTTGDDWASYYHVVSVAPIALILGLGFSRLNRRMGGERWTRAVVWIAFFLSFGLVAGRHFLQWTFPRIRIMGPAIVMVAAALAGGAWAAERFKSGGTNVRRPAGGLAAVIYAAGLALFLSILPLEAFQTARDLHPIKYEPLFQCARIFKPLIADDALILATGGESHEETGRRTAYNASYMFFWLDRKGFNIPLDRQTLAEVEGYAGRGARYFVLEKEALSVRPEFKEELLGQYPLLAECSAAYLFDLTRRR